ncbi:hypothetical protein [Vibrio coralliilyticus]|uniref:hypothetical protein n=1 Tax=Vibrio coralliilyticus TaxID=190893 RepID=UPI002FD1F102
MKGRCRKRRYFGFGLSQTIDFTLTGSYDVGDTRFAISATATSGLTVSFASSTPSVCTISGPYVAIGATGTCTIVASQAGDGTYDPAPDVSQSTTIAKYTQSILFPNPGPQNLADSSLILSAVTTANLSVTFGSNTTSVCTVSGTTLSFVTSGLCTVYADHAGDSNNNAANRVTLSFYIDNDTDGDGVIDQLDAFVNDASESFDVDSDGTGNNADTNDAVTGLLALIARVGWSPPRKPMKTIPIKMEWMSRRQTGLLRRVKMRLMQGDLVASLARLSRSTQMERSTQALMVTVSFNSVRLPVQLGVTKFLAMSSSPMMVVMWR